MARQLAAPPWSYPPTGLMAIQFLAVLRRDDHIKQGSVLFVNFSESAKVIARGRGLLHVLGCVATSAAGKDGWRAKA